MAIIRLRLSDALNHGALFLDIDGTLAEHQPDPDGVVIDPATLSAMENLRERLGGALAIVSGRDLTAIDRMLPLPDLDAIACHGAIQRSSTKVESRKITYSIELSSIIHELVKEFPRILIERKSASLAVHWRTQATAEAAIRLTLEALVESRPDLALQYGACVAEILPAGVSKGAGIAALMETAAYSGRRPIFFGDDLTDESGFAVVNALGGLSLKVGKGDTVARFRLHDTRAVAAVLTAMPDMIASSD